MASGKVCQKLLYSLSASTRRLIMKGITVGGIGKVHKGSKLQIKLYDKGC